VTNDVTLPQKGQGRDRIIFEAPYLDNGARETDGETISYDDFDASHYYNISPV